MKRSRVFWIAGILLVTALALPPLLKGKRPEFRLETDAVQRETLTTEVTATGTINAENTVEVGTQVSGVIAAAYADFNDRVKKGQIIARLDTRTLQANVAEAQASYRTAEVQLRQARRNYDRAKQLFAEKVYAQVDYENALTEYEQAEASFQTAQAKLSSSRTNLQYATITSPINGIVIDRKINVGQTVAASFNTPTLFAIASDLTRMQIEADVDEADIGQVREGQPVRFTVDAFPGRSFSGRVAQVRLQPEENQNVVTYTVVIRVANPDQQLMPGMTANLYITTREKPNVLTVPSPALAFRPDRGLAEGLRREGITLRFSSPDTAGAYVWLMRRQEVWPVAVTPGFSNDVRSEVKGSLREGDTVVTAWAAAGSDARGQSRSPFLPSLPGNNRNQGAGIRAADGR